MADGAYEDWEAKPVAAFAVGDRVIAVKHKSRGKVTAIVPEGYMVFFRYTDVLMTPDEIMSEAAFDAADENAPHYLPGFKCGDGFECVSLDGGEDGDAYLEVGAQYCHKRSLGTDDLEIGTVIGAASPVRWDDKLEKYVACSKPQM
jgi:hypothetical protein